MNEEEGEELDEGGEDLESRILWEGWLRVDRSLKGPVTVGPSIVLLLFSIFPF